jgi:chloride channel 3/4/5
MAGPSSNNHDSSGSSSSHSPTPVQTAGDQDELDLWGDGDGADLLAEDPINEDLNEPLSFKRKQKQSILSSPARLLSALTGSRSGTRPEPHSSRPRASTADGDTLLRGITSPGRNVAAANNLNHGTKDGVPLDWYVEGPGRRVGYEDLTAIDWIFEYTKERQRLRFLYSSATGLLGYLQQFADASQVWIVLVLTGLAVGAVAASIDVTTDWLGDLKTGYCSSGPEGGAFYLSKGFCCLGYDESANCAGWKSWSSALGISSGGGRWFIEYFFFILFSVSRELPAPTIFYPVLISSLGDSSI